MRHPLRVVALLGALLPGLLGVAQAADVDAATYGYPLINPFEATITTTPEALRPELPKNSSIDQDEYTINLRPERQYQLPDNFWPVKKFHYILARQSHPAPLIFIIAGTGANYAASTVDYLKRLYYSAGYHVVQVSSPTSWDFMASASRTATPGYTPQDAEDLYRAMQAIRAQHPKLPVTEYFLTGYSLGGLDAAFVAQLDESMRSFNFKRVLMVNPPVNLLTSVRNLDRLVQTEVKGVTNTRTFYELILAKLTRYFREKGYVDFNDAVVQDLQDSPERLSNEEMAMLIGSVFRFSAADISFTADLINRRGLITPPNYPITEGTSLTPFLARSLQCDFDCYMTEQVLPFWQKAFKGQAVSQLAYQSSLPALEDYLRTSKKIGVMHNADDIILGPGDLGFLRKTFGDRLTVYPYGGHCGNINYRVNANAMLEFFARG